LKHEQLLHFDCKEYQIQLSDKMKIIYKRVTHYVNVLKSVKFKAKDFIIDLSIIGVSFIINGPLVPANFS
jgi:hypothetical protein